VPKDSKGEGADWSGADWSGAEARRGEGGGVNEDEKTLTSHYKTKLK